MQARVTRGHRAAVWRPARSLSGRLIAGLVALLALGCAAVGLVTYVAIQRALMNELDNQLEAGTNVANNCLDHWLNPNGDGNNSGGGGGDDISGRPGGNPLNTMYCEGLGNGTFVAYQRSGQWGAMVVPGQITLSAADKATLSAISPSPINGPPPPCLTRELPSAGGTYELTVAEDPNGTYVTGLSLNGVHDLLKDVALAEIGVFGGALVLAGVLGTVWVRLSLRPL
ncbi:MAG TPA: hypothetical protein VFE59_03555, partial [Trebonia sp.]|nr:hypothetical protein [Trebonia sp.]